MQTESAAAQSATATELAPAKSSALKTVGVLAVGAALGAVTYWGVNKLLGSRAANQAAGAAFKAFAK
jgi:hypothetical protein